jgi:dienelactone hydrolase
MTRIKVLVAAVCAVSITILLGSVQGANAQAAPPYYEEEVASSNSLRTEQARELDAYILKTRADNSRLRSVFTPDYRSTKAFEASANRLRKVFAASIGYPPPGDPEAETPDFKRIGEDGIGVYYRVKISILPGVHAEGLYIVPKGLKGRAPLVIAMHGGGGSPEVALFHGGANYHDMVRGGAKLGYVVFAPQHLFSAEGYPGDIRNRIDERMRLVGTSLTAVEIAKITRSLDVLLKRPEVDPKRVAMLGLSYGGYYALVTPALDTRIRCAVSSCYFGVQEWRYERDELGVPSDFRFMDRFTLLRDPEIVALICPRALEIQAGSNDDPDHRDMGKQLAPQAAEYYQRLGREGEFRFMLFQGGHEFNDASAWEFVKRHL